MKTFVLICALSVWPALVWARNGSLEVNIGDPLVTALGRAENRVVQGAIQVFVNDHLALGLEIAREEIEGLGSSYVGSATRVRPPRMTTNRWGACVQGFLWGADQNGPYLGASVGSAKRAVESSVGGEVDQASGWWKGELGQQFLLGRDLLLKLFLSQSGDNFPSTTSFAEASFIERIEAPGGESIGLSLGWMF